MLRQPDNDKWTLLTTYLSKNMKILANNDVYTTSQEPMICDIGYKTPGKFWRVKRIVRKYT